MLNRSENVSAQDWSWLLFVGFLQQILILLMWYGFFRSADINERLMNGRVVCQNCLASQNQCNRIAMTLCKHAWDSAIPRPEMRECDTDVDQRRTKGSDVAVCSWSSGRSVESTKCGNIWAISCHSSTWLAHITSSSSSQDLRLLLSMPSMPCPKSKTCRIILPITGTPTRFPTPTPVRETPWYRAKSSKGKIQHNPAIEYWWYFVEGNTTKRTRIINSCLRPKELAQHNTHQRNNWADAATLTTNDVKEQNSENIFNWSARISGMYRNVAMYHRCIHEFLSMKSLRTCFLLFFFLMPPFKSGVKHLYREKSFKQVCLVHGLFLHLADSI